MSLENLKPLPFYFGLPFYPQHLLPTRTVGRCKMCGTPLEADVDWCTKTTGVAHSTVNVAGVYCGHPVLPVKIGR